MRYVFREGDWEEFKILVGKISLIVGHNILQYDLPVLYRLLGLPEIPIEKIIDTYIISKLVDYPRPKHSLESYGEEFKEDKNKFSDFTKYSIELEERCIQDVEINLKVYLKYIRYLNDVSHKSSILMEHQFQLIVNNLSNNGFSFNILRATGLLLKVEEELKVLDNSITTEFLPKLKVIRIVTPRETKYGTISLTSIPKDLRGRTEELSIGAPFSYCAWVEFNPSSHAQIISVLNQAAWRPVDRTQTHVDIEREYNKLKNTRKRSKELDIRLNELYTRLQQLRTTGWKVNENNLESLPPSAPPSTRLLAKRILLESRRRTLTEWINLVQSDGRIHGKFQGIGAWTHRMAHQNPNTANIPNEFDTQGKKKLLGKELRSLWCAPKNRLLVGVDAEGIQLRIFAHYIDDPEFTRALVEGRKDDKTDPHSLNQRVLGSVCRSRQAAKRFVYALLLGGGLDKLSQILECSREDATQALDRLMERYEGFTRFKTEIIPKDARRGYLVGLDGRKVRIPGDTEGSRRHLAMSGYLQNGEAVIMKLATLKWWSWLKDYDARLVNFVHDEWQTEVPNNMGVALTVAAMQADSLRIVGEELGLKCPLAGSYYNEDHKDYTIHTNWSRTH